MADIIQNAIDNSMVTVGPAATSGSGSLMDSFRKEDFGKASDLSPQDAKALANGARPPKLNSFEKQQAFERASQNAVQAAEAGASAQQQMDAGTAGSIKVRKAPAKEATVNNALSPEQQQLPQTEAPDEDFKRMQAERTMQMAYKEGVGVLDSLDAAWAEMTGTSSFLRLAIDSAEGKRDFKPDPLFDPLEGREKWGSRLPQADLEWIADSSSAEERQWKLSRLQETQDNYRAMNAHGEGIGQIIGLSAGMFDPVGWVAGMGVGKVARMAQLGAEATVASRAAAGAVEGAVGNIAVTAGMQAAGEHVTPGDYLYAAGFGAAFGTATGAMQRGRPAPLEDAPEHLASHPEDAQAAHAQNAAQDLTDNALRYSNGLMAEAQKRAGPDASKDEIAAAAQELFQNRVNAFYQAGHAPMPESARLLPDVDFQKLYGAPQEAQAPAPREGTGLAMDDLSPYERNQLRERGFSDEAIGQMGTEEAMGHLSPTLGTTLTNAVTANFSDAARRTEIGKQYNITPEMVPDNAQRLVMQEMLLRAVDNAPTFDERKLKTLVGQWVAPIADSKMVANFSMPQHILARSEHPLLRWWAANMTESPTQNAGSRSTAAVEHAIREREYNSFIGRYNDAYVAWRNQNGGSALKDGFGKSPHYERFDRLVYEARANRAAGLFGDEHPHVKAAADALDAGYHRAAQDQRTAKTLGSENLPDSSVGYMPRRINAAYLEANPTHRLGVVNAVYNQLVQAWGSSAEARGLARKVAAEYVNRARVEAAGGASIPAHLADPHAASALRDALAQHALSAADVDKYMARITRGGAGHTKGRLDLDLDQIVDLPDGTSFKLSDAFEQDNIGLFRNYTRRVNGEVTLTRRGIQGKMGLDQMRTLLVLSNSKGDNKKWANELAAFDQTAAEFMGSPYGTSSALADNLRILTGVSRLGQAIVPQLAETAQLAASLGTESAMRFAKDLPRLVNEVRAGKTNDLLHSLELPGGTIGDNHRYVMPWQSFDDVQLAGREANSAMSRFVRSAAQAQYTLTGHRHLVAAQMRGVSEQILHKVYRYIREGGNDPALKSMGINDQLRDALRKDMNNVATFDKDGRLTAFDIRQTDNPQAAMALKQSIERGANQIIQGNFIGERQAYLHDSLYKLLAQFRSYSLTAMSKQWTRTRVDQGTAKAVGILMGQMAFALPIHLARVAAVSALMSDDRAKEYRETNLAPEMLARATLNYATLSGSLGDILDGGMGMLGYQMSGVKSGNQQFLGNVPALGYINSTAAALKDKDASGLIKAMPGGNSVFLLPAVNFTHWLQKED